MEQPIVVKFRWSAEDMFQGYRFHARQCWRRVFRILFSGAIYTVAALCVVAGVVAYRNGSFDAGIVVCPLFALFWLLWPLFLRVLVWRQFAKRPDKNLDVEWQIMPDKVSAQTCHAHSEFDWEALAKVVRTPSALMFYSVENVFHYLPRRGFASDAEFEQATELAKSKVRKFRFVT